VSRGNLTVRVRDHLTDAELALLSDEWRAVVEDAEFTLRIVGMGRPDPVTNEVPMQIEMVGNAAWRQLEQHSDLVRDVASNAAALDAELDEALHTLSGTTHAGG
jgi:hypothetical protein